MGAEICPPKYMNNLLCLTEYPLGRSIALLGLFQPFFVLCSILSDSSIFLRIPDPLESDTCRGFVDVVCRSSAGQGGGTCEV